jgi:hypothetical protein
VQEENGAAQKGTGSILPQPGADSYRGDGPPLAFPTVLCSKSMALVAPSL